MGGGPELIGPGQQGPCSGMAAGTDARWAGACQALVLAPLPGQALFFPSLSFPVSTALLQMETLMAQEPEAPGVPAPHPTARKAGPHLGSARALRDMGGKRGGQ